jgi:hypothetical protein
MLFTKVLINPHGNCAHLGKIVADAGIDFVECNEATNQQSVRSQPWDVPDLGADWLDKASRSSKITRSK